MINKNSFFWIMTFLILLLVFTSFSYSSQNKTIDLNGLKVHIINNDQLDFYHAELLILLQTKDIDPVIPYITARTIFTKSIKSKSQISKLLRALGNDFKIIFMADHFILKIDFLRKKLPTFIKFLSVIYKSSNLLSKKNFNYEKKYISEEYIYNEDFRIKMGLFSAYKFLFKDQILGNNFFTLNQIKKCKINQAIVHYKGTYTPANSLLFITGKINIKKITDSINTHLKNIPRGFILNKKRKQININKISRPVILNIPGIMVPTILYLKLIKTSDKSNYIPSLIINDILFRQSPINVMSKKSSRYRIRRDFIVKTDILNYKGLTVISNAVKTNYRSIKNFLLLLISEIRQIKTNKVDRQSYKRAFNFFSGRAKVNSRYYFSELDKELNGFLFNGGEGLYKQESKNLLVKINDILNGEKKDLSKNKNFFSKNEAIVIIGDLSKIFKYYPKINAEIVDIE